MFRWFVPLGEADLVDGQSLASQGQRLVQFLGRDPPDALDCQRLLTQEASSEEGAAMFPKCKLLNKIFCALKKKKILIYFP